MVNLTPLSDERLAEIVAEVEVEQMAAEDAAMRDKMAGLRCQSCECPMLTPPSGPGMRRCKWCGG